MTDKPKAEPPFIDLSSYPCPPFLELDFSSYDISKVPDLTHMFDDCHEIAALKEDKP